MRTKHARLQKRAANATASFHDSAKHPGGLLQAAELAGKSSGASRFALISDLRISSLHALRNRSRSSA